MYDRDHVDESQTELRGRQLSRGSEVPLQRAADLAGQAAGLASQPRRETWSVVRGLARRRAPSP